MQLQKAVITAAGLGSRFLPASKAYQKEMIPIMDKPQLQYVVEEAIDAGITQIAIATFSGVNTIQKYFTEDDDVFWRRLHDSGKDYLMDDWRRVKQSCELFFFEQQESDPYGNGTPFILAADFVGDSTFVGMWGDDIMIKTDPTVPSLIAQLTNYYEKYHPVAVMSAMEIPLEAALKCGCYQYNQNSTIPYQAQLLVEKPTVGNIPSRYANISRFILTPQVVEELKTKTRGKDNEVWLTEAVNRLMQRGELVIAPPWVGYEWIPVGDPVNWLRANIAIARRDTRYEAKLKEMLQATH